MKTKTIVVRLTEQEYSKVKIFAERNNQNLSEAMRSLIAEKLFYATLDKQTERVVSKT